MSFRAKRIIRNTGFLYVRMLLTMAISLYTSRVLLETLGVDDFGLYHVVAGFVILAGFLQGALSGTTQRFIAYELGKSNSSCLHNVFNMSVNIHILFGFGLLVVGGVIGNLFISSILTFDEARASAVIIIFWFALFSLTINIAVVPFHAMIIAHEEMKVFAWVSVAQAILNLGIVFLIQHLPYDPLIAYGALMFLVAAIIGIIYFSYVSKKYKEYRFKLSWDQALFKQLISFSGWTIWGNAASVFANHGTNILLNIFFGPVVNAAKSIGNQASSALNQFVSNLQLAINPQIIKSYSANDPTYTNKLINYGSKYNFFLIFALAVPILLRTEEVLNVWLIEPPDNSSLFLRLILINVIIESISRPLITAAQATGKIKVYQFVVGGILLLNVPVSFLLLDAGHGPEIVFIVAILLTILAGIARILMLKRIFTFSFKQFFSDVLVRILPVSIAVISIGILLSDYIKIHNGIISFICFSLICFIVTCVVIWVVGFENHERVRFLNILKVRERVLRKLK